MKTDDWLESEQLVCTKTDGATKYDFTNFTLPFKFTLKIYGRNVTLEEAEKDHQKLNILRNRLNNDYNPRSHRKIEEKINVIESARKF